MSLKAEVFWPTLIWNTILPDEQKSLLLGVRDYILNLKETEPDGVKKTNYGGWQSTNQDISRDFIDWQIALEKAVKSACQQGQLPDLKLYNLWFNVNGFGAYNNVHTVSYTHLTLPTNREV